MFLPSVLSPASNLFSMPFLMLCSAYRLNQQDYSKRPVVPLLNLEPISCSTPALGRSGQISACSVIGWGLPEKSEIQVGPKVTNN